MQKLRLRLTAWSSSLFLFMRCQVASGMVVWDRQMLPSVLSALDFAPSLSLGFDLIERCKTCGELALSEKDEEHVHRAHTGSWVSNA